MKFGNLDVIELNKIEIRVTMSLTIQNTNKDDCDVTMSSTIQNISDECNMGEEIDFQSRSYCGYDDNNSMNI